MKAPELDKRTVALSAFREVTGGRGRQYTATTFIHDPWLGCNHILRMAAACGFISPDTEGCYAVLDALADNDDVIQNFGIPSAQAFRWFYRKLHWRVCDEDGLR